MIFDPQPGQKLVINGEDYFVFEHPSAPGMPYGQSGRTATVYKLINKKGAYALKVFFPRFRTPSLVHLADQIAPFASMPGLQVCQRIVLTPRRHGDLLSTFPDLTYSVLMPWVDGKTWFDILTQKQVLIPDESIKLARAFAEILVGMEESSIAHCDLSAPNLIVNSLSDIGRETTAGNVFLVDVEGLFAPSLNPPETGSSGSFGYAHPNGSQAVWNRLADRFAGGVLLAEILGWSDPQVRDNSFGESFFDPKEMQKSNQRFHILTNTLQEKWGIDTTVLIKRLWTSETVGDCPTFGEWLAVLPKEYHNPTIDSNSSNYQEGKELQILIREFTVLAKKLINLGNLDGAILTYKHLLEMLPVGSQDALEFQREIHNLEQEFETKNGTNGLSVEKITITPSEVMQEPKEGSELARNAHGTDKIKITHSSDEVNSGEEPVNGLISGKELFTEAQKAINEGDWQKAKTLLEKLISIWPNFEMRGEKAKDKLEEVEAHIKNFPVEPSTEHESSGNAGWIALLVIIIFVIFIMMSVTSR